MKKCIAVFGAGLSGQSVANLARSEGYSVTVFDEKDGYRNHFSQSDVGSFDAFIFSPGFSKNHQWRVLLSLNNSLYGELGYAAERWQGKIIGVTGTNGKTTVTRLLETMLRACGKEAFVAGNIGRPFSELVSSQANHKNAIAVCEISSFQAEITKGLSLDGLIWTNFAEDHMDRYENMTDYFESKFALFACLKESSTVCVSEELLDFKEASFWKSHGAKLVKVDQSLPESVEVSSVFHSYPHLFNYNLARGFIEALGMKDKDFDSIANDFKLDAHRLSIIFEKEGLKIWEDSKSTNLHSVLGALKAIEGSVIWIGGGASKNTDLSKFANRVAPLVDRVIVYGAVGEALNEAFLSLEKRSIYYEQLVDAIRESVQLSRGEKSVNIVFSPGFASFDQFDSYQERGKFFQKTIFSLLKESGSL